MAQTGEAAISDKPPRSRYHAEKTIKSEGSIILHGKHFYKRTFTDGSAELARFHARGGKWVIQCFQA
jgi:hypothetical protein